jgi:transposase
MGRKQTHYTQEFKEQAIRLMTEGGMSLGQAAWELGINDKMLSRWKRLALAQGLQDQARQPATEKGLSQPSFQKRPAEPMTEELARLRCENAVLRHEKEVLKKVVAIFSQPPP